MSPVSAAAGNRNLLMEARMSRLLIRVIAIAGIGLTTSWLLLAGPSPVSNYLTDKPFITNIASAVNLPTTLYALAGFPGRAAPSESTIALVAVSQWLLYGVLASWCWHVLRGRAVPNATANGDVAD